MTTDQASDVVEKTQEVREDIIQSLVDARPEDILSLLEDLVAANNAYYDALEVWYDLDKADSIT